MEVFSASEQKIGKLSIGSSESSEQSVEFEFGKEFLISKYELEDLVSLLKSTLSCKKTQLSFPSSPLDTLRYLVETLCAEYTKEVIPVQEINLKNERLIDEYVSVNVMRTKNSDLVSKVFVASDKGEFFSGEECKRFSALVIGAVRDSASHGLKKRVGELQEKVIGLAGVISQLKRELREKRLEVEDLVERGKSGQERVSRKTEDYTMWSESSVERVGLSYC